MTYLFVKEYYGEEYAQDYLTELHIPLFEKKGTERDVKLIEMKYNDNHDVVYRKGLLLIKKWYTDGEKLIDCFLLRSFIANTAIREICRMKCL